MMDSSSSNRVPKHPSVEHVIQFFEFGHLPEPLRAVSLGFAALATKVANNAPDDPETTVALRKLLESKDAAVRAMVSVRNRSRFNNGHPDSGGTNG